MGADSGQHPHVITELSLSVIKTEDCEGHCAHMSLFTIMLGALYFGNRLCYLSHQQEDVTLSVPDKTCCIPLKAFEIHNSQLADTG